MGVRQSPLRASGTLVAAVPVSDAGVQIHGVAAVAASSARKAPVVHQRNVRPIEDGKITRLRQHACGSTHAVSGTRQAQAALGDNVSLNFRRALADRVADRVDVERAPGHFR